MNNLTHTVTYYETYKGQTTKRESGFIGESHARKAVCTYLNNYPVKDLEVETKANGSTHYSGYSFLSHFTLVLKKA
jgi:hypothetical protein